MINDKLPKVPSELLQLALNDMKQTIKAGVNINMNKWGTNINTPKKCTVCFAGAVMLNTLKLNENENENLDTWRDYTSPNDTIALNALDEFRKGYLLEPLITLGYTSNKIYATDKFNTTYNNIIIPNEFIEGWTQYEYCNNDDEFFKQIDELINYLKSINQ